MRIGFLTYGLDRSPTGIGRYAVELLRAMAALPGRHDLVVLATEPNDVHRLGDVCEYHSLPGCRLLPALLTLGDAAVAAAARRFRLDLIHDPNGIAPFLSPFGETRRTVTIHDAFAYVYPQTHNRLDNWRYQWHLPHAARRSDAVITISDCSKRDLVRYLGLSPEAVHVTSEGVQPAFRPIPDDCHRRDMLMRYGIDRPYILYVGGLNARKNVGRLLEAYASVRNTFPDLAMIVGGKRQWKTDDIDGAISRLDLEQHVHFTGYIDDADLPAIYSAASAFVFPSLYEGFGLPPLEAMACGTPVITSNVSSLPDVVGQAGLTVDPFDVSAIADSITRVIADPALQHRMSECGRQRASQFTWERAASETLAIFEQVLQQPIPSTNRRRKLRSDVINEGRD